MCPQGRPRGQERPQGLHLRQLHPTIRFYHKNFSLKVYATTAIRFFVGITKSLDVKKLFKLLWATKKKYSHASQGVLTFLG